MARFKNREGAAKELLTKLSKYKDDINALVVGLPRGGMVTASVISKELNIPLAFLIVKKIGAPGDPELAIGAVTDNGGTFMDRQMINSMNISEKYLNDEIDKKKEETKTRSEEYSKNYKNPVFSDKTVILTDDGIATGTTMIAAIRSLAKHGARKIVVAVPAGPCENFSKIRKETDEIICMGEDLNLSAVGEYYDEFPEVTDDEVITILKNAKNTNNK